MKGDTMSRVCECGSTHFFIAKKVRNTGLYCTICGKWQKWLSAQEIKEFRRTTSSEEDEE